MKKELLNNKCSLLQCSTVFTAKVNTTIFSHQSFLCNVYPTLLLENPIDTYNPSDASKPPNASNTFIIL